MEGGKKKGGGGERGREIVIPQKKGLEPEAEQLLVYSWHVHAAATAAV